MEDQNKFYDADPVKLYRVVAWLVLGTLVFGFWGYWIYESKSDLLKNPDPLTVIYHSSQLLVGHGVHLDREIPWQLHVGRIFGIIFIFSVGLTAFALFFRQEILLYRLRLKWRKNHIVICGLGNLGLRLAISARRSGKLVVGIENKEEHSSIEQARKSGIIVFEGDATEEFMLKKAHADKAKYIVACCSQDETNIAIASRLGRIMKSSKREKQLVCRLLLHNDHLRKVLMDRFWNEVHNLPANYQVNYHDLDYHSVVARKCINDFPLDFKPVSSDTFEKVHVIIIGFDKMGQEIFLQSARLGHYANAIQCNRKLKVTLIDPDITSKYQDFKIRYNKIERICEVRLINSNNCNKVEFRMDELMTFIFCFEKENGYTADDHKNMEAGMDLFRKNHDKEIQILAFQNTNSGLAALFPSEPEAYPSFPKLGSFGMIENIYTWDLIIHETLDRMAQNFHENYLTTVGKAKNSKKREKSDEWGNQTEDIRESNRQVADHLAIKLRAIGYHYRKWKFGLKRLKEINEADILILAQMEHKRYCAERWLNGWEYAEITDKPKKLNSTLICWEELKPEDKKKDTDQVRLIIDMLGLFGYGVYGN
jgi:hypothetical protein